MVWSGCMGKKAFCAFLTMQIEPMHPSIQFTMHYRRSVHYLDAALAIEFDGRILSDLYIKPTDSHQYDMAFLGVCLELSFNISVTIQQSPSPRSRTPLMDWPDGFIKSFHPMNNKLVVLHFNSKGQGTQISGLKKKAAQYTTAR